MTRPLDQRVYLGVIETIIFAIRREAPDQEHRITGMVRRHLSAPTVGRQVFEEAIVRQVDRDRRAALLDRKVQIWEQLAGLPEPIRTMKLYERLLPFLLSPEYLAIGEAPDQLRQEVEAECAAFMACLPPELRAG